MGEAGTKGDLITFGKTSSFTAGSILCQTKLYFNKEQIKLQNIKLKARDPNFMVCKSKLD